MKSITILITVLLVPIAATASVTDPDLSHIIEVCQKAFPQDESKTAKCIIKAAGLESPPPTQEQVNSMYGAPDDPVRAQRLHNEWAEQLNAHQKSYKACFGLPDWQRCIGEASRQELVIHEKLMEALKPPAWPSTLSLRYFVAYSIDEASTKVSQCDMGSKTEQDKCVKKIADEGYHAGMQALLHKVKDHMERETAQQAARHQEASDRLRRLRQDELRAQREHEMDLARIQALGMILWNGGLFRPVQPPPTYQPQPYQVQPAPVLTLPPYQPNPARPPVSCTSRAVGSMLYTDCF